MVPAGIGLFMFKNTDTRLRSARPGALVGVSQLWRSQKGMTLVEVAVAAALLSLVIAPLFRSLAAGVRYAEEYRRWASALSIAQGIMEEMIDRPFAAVTSEPAGCDLTGEEGALPVSGRPGYAYKVAVGPESGGLKEVRVAVYYRLYGRQHRVLLAGVKSRR